MMEKAVNQLRQRWNIRSTLILCVVIICLLFSLPIVSYIIFVHTDFSQSVSSLALNYTSNNSIICDSSKYTRQGSNESVTNKCHDYIIGGICEDMLLEWNVCTYINSTSLKTNTSYSSQSSINKNIQQISDLLKSTYPECHIVAIPFLCQFYFPLSDCSNTIYTASLEECERITTTVCAVPWQLASSFGKDLPSCDSLEQSRDDVPMDYDNNSNASAIAGDVFDQNNSHILCRDDFLQQNDTCVPKCDTFTIYPNGQRAFRDVCLFIAAIFSTLSFVVFIIYSLKERKKILYFPDIFTFFLSIDFGILGIILLVIFTFKSKLFCTSSNSIETLLNEPTIFCKLSGVIFHYVIVNTAVWWFIHLFILTFRLAFPFASLKMDEEGKFRVVYWITLIIGVLFPLPAIVICLTVEKYRYRISSLPPDNYCAPPNEMSFYSIILPINILMGIGACCLCYILLMLYRIKNNTTQNLRRKKTALPDKRLLSVFLVYLVFAAYNMVQASVAFSYTQMLQSKLTDYFQCEALGYTPGKCNRNDFEVFTLAVPNGITYLILSLTPINILCFIINWIKCWKKCRKQKTLPIVGAVTKLKNEAVTVDISL